jgi:hypothetical protein
MSVKDLAFETLRVAVDDRVLTVTLDDTGNPALEMLDFRSRDHREAIAAFKEGRPPVFTGS